MQVRLGFAIATALQPDVLLLDEILAVGDAGFRARCYNRIGSLQREAAVIFVSHTMEHIARISTRVLVLANGKAVFQGTPEEGVAVYETANRADDAKDAGFITVVDPVTAGRVAVASPRVGWNESLLIDVEIECREAIPEPAFYGVLYDAAGSVAASFVAESKSRSLEPGMNHVRLHVEHLPLATGTYRVGLSMHPPKNITNLLWSHKQAVLTVHSSTAGFSTCRLPVKVRVESVEACRP